MKRASFSLSAAIILAAFALTGTLMWTANPATTAPIAPIAAPTARNHTEVVTQAVAFMASQVISDGSLSNDPFASIKGVIALAAAGMPQQTLAHTVTGKTPLDFLHTQALTYTADTSGTLLPGRLGMVAVAAIAADADAGNFGGMDVIASLHSIYQPTTGAYSTTAIAGWTTGAASTINQLWAMLGLAATQENIPITATQFLLDLQEMDGGWGYGFGGDVDTTALTIQALLASGHITVASPAISDAVAFLKQNQDTTGAWGYSFGGTYYPSADTTAATLQALAILGYSPANITWAVPGGDPHSALIAMQRADGSFSDNALGTAHAIAGLTETPLPVWGRQQRADLSQSTKSVTPARATSGDTITYTLSLSNTSALTATAVLMRDALPWPVTFDSWVQQSNALTGTHGITWAGDIAPRTQIDIVFTVKVLMPNASNSLLITGPVSNTCTYGSPNTMIGEDTARFDFYIMSQVFLPLVMRTAAP